MWALAFIVVVLRLVVRYRTTSRLYWDDFFAILGMLWLTVMVIMNNLSRDGIYVQMDMATLGYPSNPKFLVQDKMTARMLISNEILGQKKMQFAFMVAFWNCLWSAKASLLMFYRRLFAGVDGYMRWWWVVVASCIVTWMISLLTDFMVCLPLRRRFSMDSADICSTRPAINAIYVATALDVATDIMVAVLPISLLIGLRMNLQKKIAIGAIFALGVVVIFFSAFRMVKVLDSIKVGNPKGLLSLALWSMLEAAVGMFSLPPTKHDLYLTNHSCHRRLPPHPQIPHLPTKRPVRLHWQKVNRRHIRCSRPFRAVI